MQIDWLTIAAQIVNFLILAWLLKRFLYRPITQAMARREERIETRLSEAKAAREVAEADAGRLREQQQALEASREEILSEARREAAALRARLEDDIREEMKVKHSKWRTHLEDEREAFAARLRHLAGHKVIDIVGRILKDYGGGDLAGQMVNIFVERLAGLDTEEREKLSAAASRTEGPALVESSAALRPGVRSQITRAVHECIGHDIEVDYQEDKTLLMGIRLTIGEQTVEWSAARFLHRVETTLDEVINSNSRMSTGAQAVR